MTPLLQGRTKDIGFTNPYLEISKEKFLLFCLFCEQKIVQCTKRASNDALFSSA
jgi:hypothetical protein